MLISFFNFKAKSLEVHKLQGLCAKTILSAKML